jgi:hypothetical protein
MFDRDVSDALMLKSSELYEVGRLGRDLNPKRMAETLFSAVVHAVFILTACVAAFPGMDVHKAGDYFTWGTTVYSCLIVVCSYRVAYLTSTWNWICVVFLFLSVTGYVVFLMVYGVWQALGASMYSVPYHMSNNLPFWITIIAVLCVAIASDGICSWILLQLFPDPKDLILENITTGKLQQVEATAMPVHTTSNKSGRTSSFAFDHPMEVPRKVESLTMHPKAGDTSLVDDQPVTVGAAQTRASSGSRGGKVVPLPEKTEGNGCDETVPASNSKLLSFGTGGRPPDWDFAQQRLPSRQFEITWKISLAAPLGACVILTLLGLMTFVASDTVEEVRIQYDGEAQSGSASTLRHVACAAGQHGETTRCTFAIKLEKEMEPPIRISYVIAPFYQNYQQNVLSILNSELQGDEISSSSRWRCEDSKSALTADGEDMFPCGLQATSFFNDTFELSGLPIDTAGIAWESDVQRFANPASYPNRPKTSWLYERYATIVTQAEGVKNERFVSWMRPQALPRVMKPLGEIETKLEAGQTLTVNINASFPVNKLKARKELVLSTYNAFGGKNPDLILYLWVSAGTSGVLGGVALIIQIIRPRQLGDPRCSRGVL